MPATTFADQDAGDTLTLSASVEGGGAWIAAHDSGPDAVGARRVADAQHGQGPAVLAVQALFRHHTEA